MKKIIAVSLTILLLAAALSGCDQTVEPAGPGTQESPATSGTPAAGNSPSGQAPSNTADPSQPAKTGVRLNIVSTIFPQYDWVRQVLGDRADDMELVLLLNNRIDLHNFQPSVEDIVRIAACDLFIYVGGESDGWVEDVLKQATNPDMVTINLLDILGDSARIDEILEGLEEIHDDHGHGHSHSHGHSHGHDDDDDDDDDDEHEHGYDEHVWLSLTNAAIFSSVIADALSELDPDFAEDYKANMSAYAMKLLDLDMEFLAAANAAPVRTLLFGDRFPFRYLMEDYGITYYAAFPGCSAETEASFSTIVFLTTKMNELGLKYVLVTESSDQSIARTIISSTTAKDQQILVLDAMQSVTSGDLARGATFLSIMEENLNVLRQALS